MILPHLHFNTKEHKAGQGSPLRKKACIHNQEMASIEFLTKNQSLWKGSLGPPDEMKLNLLHTPQTP